MSVPHSNVIQPGSTLGVLGSGQLGRMFTIAARRLGYRVHVLSPDDDTPTGQVADMEVRASYDDLDAIAKFAQGVSVVTFEFENVPSATTAAAEKFAPVRPGGHVLHVTQNRLREKNFLRGQGIATTPYHAIHNEQQLRSALLQTGYPAVLKTADWGYDGKGQAKIQQADEISGLWPKFDGQESILEAYVDFACEISVVAARGLAGDFVAYGPIHNSHSNHILDVSICPAPVAESVASEAIEITRTIFEKLDVVGVLTVEFFVTRENRLLVNELAPRPHNSGHYGIDACVSCQFEQQVRAVCGLPLGSVRQHRPAAMVNLLGDVWQPNAPRWDLALSNPEIKLHLYGKAEPRAGRKMGHLTALADTPQAAAELALNARAALQSGC
ncbi:5-(carboxyamino)imidazole ribonucleotide synthase [Anatilimnocola sp. NA78]|uniref:5-(carboxyamino)imidazole ribonucleotide synthase n=1 Tax=Anatilimnocola sp. NA78 TaxID=3415683 RepID=UPI003CE567B9